ncbi:MAG: 30S ribosomal protein S5 [Candidatus Aenigmarchaeota archaeon]|nr:30S ribosomal protein S5 [Candidatus Aenigmarchaeota archaeon]
MTKKKNDDAEKKKRNKKTLEESTVKEAPSETKKNRGEEEESQTKPEESQKKKETREEVKTGGWIPTTELGQAVMRGEITSIDEIFARGLKIKEPGIVDKLLPNLESEIILIGGSPGKGGGIRRTPTKKTARMHKSGRRFKVSAVVVVGNRDGYLGIGKASAVEHVPAIEKATTEAKLNIIPIKRGCGSWECGCGEKHSIPFAVEGKRGSVRVILKPAPKGVGLCVNDEMKKIISLAGIKDIWSKSFGNTRSRVNASFAVFNALKKLNAMKVPTTNISHTLEEDKETKKKKEGSIKSKATPKKIRKKPHKKSNE